MKFTLLFFIIFYVSCKYNEKLKVCNEQKQTCFHLLKNKRNVIIYNNKEDLKNDTNYIKFKMDGYHFGGSLNLCWNESKSKKWNVVVEGAIIIKDKLDTTKFDFDNKLPLDSGGIPTEAPFRSFNCATISMDSWESSPPSTTLIIK